MLFVHPHGFREAGTRAGWEQSMDLSHTLAALALPIVMPSAPLHPATKRTERMEPRLGAMHYRVKIRFRDEAQATETRFQLEPTPVLVTRNRVQKPRMGRWKLESLQKGGQKNGPHLAPILARVERMLYFSGPTTNVVQSSTTVQFGSTRCKLWQVQVPTNLPLYAYLAEVRPGLLALSYLSGSFPKGDLASLEIQLESFHLNADAAPAENGTALLRTLRRMTTEAQNASESKVMDNGLEVVAVE